MKSRKNITVFILLIIGVFILLNYLSNQFFFRLDFTEDKRYTLSDATREILSDLEEPVTVSAYFSGNLPPQLEQVKNEVRDMLAEYTSRSKGMLAYEFIDPLKDDELKAQASQAGIPQM